ncbi:ROK family transcriptional regulator [Shouchella tritolerans]|uniref:ROK family transcriptional regulator n=1 Tax=Shouchella tritolerans TaxID=2979466 RepID=UPI00078700C1|nr:ROK family transcriptional regulator [Shouchella tritolerans]
MITIDHETMKDMNKSTVFRLIQRHAPISRADIAKRSGLNKATVSALVAQLIENQFVYEIGTGDSSGGRKPVLLYCNDHASHAISVDIGVNGLLGIITDLSGKTIAKREMALTSKQFNIVLANTEAIIEQLMQEAPPAPYGICGITASVPGIVDSKGNILLAPNLGWENVDIKTALEDKFKLPVVVINEANAGALGEKQYGVGKPYSAISYISVSIGIGTGQIIDGKLFTGANGFAGEFGHMSIDRHGKQCRCGNQGCWELYSSEKALLEIAASKMNRPSISFEEVLAAARSQNQAALDAFATVGHSLGTGLVSMIHSMNPEAIIIGNRFAKLKPYIQIPIEETLAKQLPSYYQKAVKLLFSELGQEAPLLGGSLLATSQFFNRHRIHLTVH